MFLGKRVHGRSIMNLNASISASVTPQSRRYSSILRASGSPGLPYFAKPASKCYVPRACFGSSTPGMDIPL